jgi:hypothetical protein
MGLRLILFWKWKLDKRVCYWREIYDGKLDTLRWNNIIFIGWDFKVSLNMYDFIWEE